MPESKHRRKGTARSRPREQRAAAQRQAAETRRRPPPSWWPQVAVGLVVLAVVVIVVGYFVTGLTAGLPLLGSNWSLVIGFVLLSVGLGMLTRWE